MKELIEKLMDCTGRIQDIQEEMENIEEELVGMELIYQGNHASVILVSRNFQNITLYVENEDGESWEVYLPFEEVLELVSQ